jgi:hypothetical protein
MEHVRSDPACSGEVVSQRSAWRSPSGVRPLQPRGPADRPTEPGVGVAVTDKHQPHHRSRYDGGALKAAGALPTRMALDFLIPR